MNPNGRYSPLVWRRRNKSFTLVELILAVSIFAIISTAFYSTFRSGISAYRRLANVNQDLRRLNDFLEDFSTELDSSFVYGDIIEFEGSGEQISFAAIKGNSPRKINYYLKDNKIIRTEESLSDLYQETAPIEKELLSGVTQFSLNYAYSDPGNPPLALLWDGQWKESTKVPRYVKVEINHLTRYLTIPTGEVLNLI